MIVCEKRRPRGRLWHLGGRRRAGGRTRRSEFGRVEIHRLEGGAHQSARGVEREGLADIGAGIVGHRLPERGILDQACVERGYWKILARASSKGSMNSEGLEEGDANFSSVNGLLSPPEEKTAEQNDSSPENRN